MSQAASSSRPAGSPLPRTAAQGPNNQTKILDTQGGRILCLADIRGRLSVLNQLVKENNAKAIIHTGDFGFYEISSLDRINDRTLRHLLMYSPLIGAPQRNQLLAQETTPANQRQTLHGSNLELLSEFPKLLSGEIKLQVPVFTVWGACEDVQVLEKFRMGIYDVENLHVLDEATTRCLEVGGIKLRILGLGGAYVPHKLFDNGDGQATIAGGMGTMWTTALQIGELVDTAQRVYDASETRLLVTHGSPGREGLLAQLALVTRADLTISGGLHFRYATSYNEFSVQHDAEGFRNKIIKGKETVDKIWESVKAQVEGVVDDQQRILLEKFLSVVERVPPQTGTGPGAASEEPSWKNCWNWNLCDAAYGLLLFDIRDARVSAELKSQGFNYAYRRSATTNPPAAGAAAATTPQANAANLPTSKPQPQAAPPEPKPPASEVASSPGAQEKESQVNGHAASPGNAAFEKAEQKKKERKEKEKEKREKQKVEREKEKMEKQQQAAAATVAAASPDGTVSAEQPESNADGDGDHPGPTETATQENAKAPVDGEVPTSPVVSTPTESTGNRTPTSRRPHRNPWTLFMKLPAPVLESELRDFFQDAKDGITKVNMPPNHFGRGRIAYIEFGDEESMKAGLEKHAEKLKDQAVTVTIAEDRSSNYSGGFRGRGRGGGFAQRNFAAAGLTHRKHSTGNAIPNEKKGD